jgi:hypothetical protein
MDEPGAFLMRGLAKVRAEFSLTALAYNPWRALNIYAFTKPGDVSGQTFARSLGAVWAGGSEETPPEQPDAASRRVAPSLRLDLISDRDSHRLHRHGTVVTAIRGPSPLGHAALSSACGKGR